jgi:F-type H+-transporting ATPase subunit beta
MKGKITAIKGIVVEVKFEEQAPKVYDALVIEPKNSNGDTVVIEVLQLLDDGIVRGIAMNATDGIRR